MEGSAGSIGERFDKGARFLWENLAPTLMFQSTPIWITFPTEMNPTAAKAFQTLELGETASLEEVKQAYRLLVKVWHPDRFTGNAKLQRAAEAKMTEINLAYELLQCIKDADALYQRACDLVFGRGVAKDSTQAVNYFRQAAEIGHAEAEVFLGLLYQNGDGVTEDGAEAVKWFREAAMHGSSTGQRSLGECCEKGFGVHQNASEAVRWYRMAAERGDRHGQEHLARCYEKGIGVQPDKAEAANWLAKATQLLRKEAEKGNREAQAELADRYRDGAGVARDNVEAANWYLKAAEQGRASCQEWIGLCYSKGIGVQQSYENAVKWYLRAAEQRCFSYHEALGDFYHYGRGVPRDYCEAYKYYNLPAGGAAWFKDGLASLTAKMTRIQIEEGERRIQEFRRTHPEPAA
jgi:TPR repeat protein